MRLVALLSIEDDKSVLELPLRCIKGLIKVFNLFNIFIITETLFYYVERFARNCLLRLTVMILTEYEDQFENTLNL